MSVKARAGKVVERRIERFIAVASPGILTIFTLRISSIQGTLTLVEALYQSYGRLDMPPALESDHLTLAQGRDLGRAKPQFLAVNALVVGAQCRTERFRHRRLTIQAQR